MKKISKTKQLLNKLSKKQKVHYIKYSGLSCPVLKEEKLDKAGWDYNAYAHHRYISFPTKNGKVILFDALSTLFLTKKEAKIGFLKILKRNRKYIIAYMNKLQKEVDKIDQQLKNF